MSGKLFRGTAVLAGVLLGSLVLVSVANAGTRSGVRGGSSSPSITSPSPISMPVSSGGISNTTSGSVQSGGNSGGNVTTGDENVEVNVVNVGPTNSNTTVTNEVEEETPAEPESSCDSRVSRCTQGVRSR